jgi:hypothetical protein
MAIHDLALVCYIMDSMADLCRYLSWRIEHLPKILAVDETDLVRAFLNFEENSKKFKKFDVAILSPLGLDPGLRAGCDPPLSGPLLKEQIQFARTLPAFRTKNERPFRR